MKKLKDNVPPFVVTDGPYKGRKYQRGMRYADSDIPPGYGKKFETVEVVQTPAESAAPVKSTRRAKK